MRRTWVIILFWAWSLGCPSSQKTPDAAVHKRSVPTPGAGTGLPVWEPPSDVPATLPLIDAPGLKALGLSGQLPRKAALVALLRAGHYAELTRFIEHIATEVERDHRKELWMMAAMNAFFQAAPDLQERLDAWLEHSRGSFAPWSARAHYLFAVAVETRGRKYASETKDSQFAAMRTFNDRAAADVGEALRRAPKVLENLRWRMKVALFGGGAVNGRRMLDDALAVCKDCFTPYYAYSIFLRPQWGGSFAQMDALAAEAVKASRNPAMNVLAGASYLEKCEGAWVDGKVDVAVAECDKALAAARWSDYLLTRGRLHAKANELDKALALYNEALGQGPEDAQALGLRASVLRTLGRWEEARNDVLLAIYVEPNQGYVKRQRWDVMRQVLKVAAERYKAKDWPGAQALYDQALRIQPDDPEPWFWRGMTQRQQQQEDAALADFKEATRHTRKWSLAYKNLAAAYMKRNQPSDAIEMWNGFIDDNPDAAEAIYLRSGAYHRLGDKERSLADLKRACGLKFDKACNVLADGKVK